MANAAVGGAGGGCPSFCLFAFALAAAALRSSRLVAGSCCGWHSLRTVRELLSCNLALSAIDFTMCRFVKVLVFSFVRTGKGSFDTHEQRPKGNTFATLSLQECS